MADKNQEQLLDKLKKSLLPTEFNRQKELKKVLDSKFAAEDEKCQRLMKEMIEKRSRGEDVEDKFAELNEARTQRKNYLYETKELFQKQVAMQQNFVKMIDKNINDMESDQKFIEQVEQQYRTDDNELSNEIYAKPNW